MAYSLAINIYIYMISIFISLPNSLPFLIRLLFGVVCREVATRSFFFYVFAFYFGVNLLFLGSLSVEN